jgi:hypothetical protein
MSLTLYVPPGIGDFSAMYSKLCNLNREIYIRTSNDSPNRLSPFLELLPNLKDAGYAGHDAMVAVSNTLPPGTDLSSIQDGDYFLAINRFLEEGGRVADWVPGKTTYHYKMNLWDYPEKADEFFLTIPARRGPIVGVYCSAYGNARHWGFWTYEKWRTFLELVSSVLPEDTQYIFLGAEYDVQIAEQLQVWMEAVGLQSHLTLGLFHIGTTIEIIRNLDYFFVFPSGLGFLADVVDTPHMMWFPHHLSPMMGTFCDPENYEARQSFHLEFSEPESAFKRFKEVGLRFLEDKTCRISHEFCERNQLKSSSMK